MTNVQIQLLSWFSAGAFVLYLYVRYLIKGSDNKKDISPPEKEKEPSNPEVNQNIDRLGKLEKLGKLYSDKVLTEEEFKKEKTRILDL